MNNQTPYPYNLLNVILGSEEAEKINSVCASKNVREMLSFLEGNCEYNLEYVEDKYRMQLSGEELANKYCRNDKKTLTYIDNKATELMCRHSLIARYGIEYAARYGKCLADFVELDVDTTYLLALIRAGVHTMVQFVLKEKDELVPRYLKDSEYKEIAEKIYLRGDINRFQIFRKFSSGPEVIDKANNVLATHLNQTISNLHGFAIANDVYSLFWRDPISKKSGYIPENTNLLFRMWGLAYEFEPVGRNMCKITLAKCPDVGRTKEESIKNGEKSMSQKMSIITEFPKEVEEDVVYAFNIKDYPFYPGLFGNQVGDYCYFIGHKGKLYSALYDIDQRRWVPKDFIDLEDNEDDDEEYEKARSNARWEFKKYVSDTIEFGEFPETKWSKWSAQFQLYYEDAYGCYYRDCPARALGLTEINHCLEKAGMSCRLYHDTTSKTYVLKEESNVMEEKKVASEEKTTFGFSKEGLYEALTIATPVVPKKMAQHIVYDIKCPHCGNVMTGVTFASVCSHCGQKFNFNVPEFTR